MALYVTNTGNLDKRFSCAHLTIGPGMNPLYNFQNFHKWYNQFKEWQEGGDHVVRTWVYKSEDGYHFVASGKQSFCLVFKLESDANKFKPYRSIMRKEKINNLIGWE